MFVWKLSTLTHYQGPTPVPSSLNAYCNQKAAVTSISTREGAVPAGLVLLLFKGHRWVESGGVSVLSLASTGYKWEEKK